MKFARQSIAFLSIGVLVASFLVVPTVFAAKTGEPCSTQAGLGGSLFCEDGSVCQADATAPGNANGFCFAQLPQGPESAAGVLNIIKTITNWVFAFFVAISIIFLLWGAFSFVTGSGDPQKVADAKSRLLYAVIGIALALLANAVPAVLRDILT